MRKTDIRQKNKTKRTPWYLKMCVLYTGTLIACLFVFITLYAVIGVMKSGMAIFGPVWYPEGNAYGIMPMIKSTFLLALTSMLWGTFLSFGCIAYIHGGGTVQVSKIIVSVIRLMTAVPTVVYGFASVFILVPFVRDYFGGSGYSWFTATIMLGFLITPTMIITMNKAVSEIKEETRLTTASLGLTEQQTFVHIIIPASEKWLFSAVILGFGRALGDTMIPTMLAGNATRNVTSPLQAMRTLTAHIGLVLSSDIGGTAYYSLFVAGGILLVTSILFNLLIKKLRGDFR